MVNEYVIKKYKGRKYYDPNQSCYITLNVIVDLSKDHDIIVIDHEGKNITLPTLFEGLSSVIKQRFILGHIKARDGKFLNSTIDQIRKVIL